ncbi:MAG: hypothetical protein COA78_01805 [Blastopirellula sp.]|nr:MAG: hypothetical protein COA78_01805 [Blastopirellula sp.]
MSLSDTKYSDTKPGIQLDKVMNQSETGSHINNKDSKHDTSRGLESNDRETTYFSSRVSMSVAESFQIWIDGVGGYRLLLADQVMIGQAVPHSGVDVPILADLSRRHAWIRRVGSDYVLDPLSPTSIGKQVATQPTVLRDNNTIGLGRNVGLRFRKQHPLSSSAVLTMISRQRMEPACDAVVLMGESCILGPNTRNHIVCPKWQEDVVLFKKNGILQVKVKQNYLIQGRPVTGIQEIKESTSVQGEDFSFFLERVETS